MVCYFTLFKPPLVFVFVTHYSYADDDNDDDDDHDHDYTLKYDMDIISRGVPQDRN